MEDQPYTVFAQAMDRSGYARATLAPRIGLEAPVPALDPRAILTMADMGHGDQAGHDMTGHGMKMDTPEAGKTEDSSDDHTSMNHAEMYHYGMGPAAPHTAPTKSEHQGHAQR